MHRTVISFRGREKLLEGAIVSALNADFCVDERGRLAVALKQMRKRPPSELCPAHSARVQARQAMVAALVVAPMTSPRYVWLFTAL